MIQISRYAGGAMQGSGQAMACITAHPYGCPVLRAACKGVSPPLTPTREGHSPSSGLSPRNTRRVSHEL